MLFARRWPAAAHTAAVIWSPDLGVFAVAAEGVLCGFAYVVDALPANSVSAADAVHTSLLLLFLELSRYCLNAVRLHVYAADVLVRRGVDGDDSR